MPLLLFVVFLMGSTAFGQEQLDGRRIARIDIVLVGATASNAAAAEQYRIIAADNIGPTYHAPRVRDAIDALYRTKLIETVVASAQLGAGGDVDVRFDIKRKSQAQRISIVIGNVVGDPITEQDLMFKLNLLAPGTPITEEILRDNANEILAYLRDRGFYQSTVTFDQHPLQNENEVGVTFNVTPGAEAKVADLRVDIAGYTTPIDDSIFKLKKDGIYSHERLTADVSKVKDLLRKEDYLAPELDEINPVYDPDTNTISVHITGKVGPKVTVVIDPAKAKVSKATQTRLLPIKREGSLDFSAIVEGERRLENYFQEQGYFFANVTPVCSATPPLVDSENNQLTNGSEFLCSLLGGEDLMGHQVEVKYAVDLNRKLRLTELRLKGTDKLTIDDIKTVLGSQEASLWGAIPVLGYGRGYTSQAILDDDAATIRSLMAELGYRDAQVHVNQGVALNGDDLIITFEVEEGLPTVINDVSIVGNRAVPTAELMNQLPVLVGQNYSRAKVRNAARKLSEFYSEKGYYDARVTPSLIEPVGPAVNDKRVAKVEFKVESEGKKVIINRILINGAQATKNDAIMKAITLRKGELLRSADMYTSEQNLYSTDAFSRVDIKTQPAGDLPDGSRLADLIVNVEEQPPRLLSYGGGFSTDLGANGFVDIRHQNLFGKLWQGGLSLRGSRLQQIAQINFSNPRFLPDGEKRYAPLTFTALFQRDSTVTRFFRSAFDRGTFGIVQRIDANGNPIDEFGNGAGRPTLNRLAFSLETNKTLSRKARSVVFFRYRFEDVRLENIESLLIKDLLRPEKENRISGFGVTYVRDTRQNCSVQYSLLELIAKGEPTDPCKYNASDPTRGQYLTADYNISLPGLGANIGFQKFQASYNYFYTFPSFRNTTFAARGVIGLGQVFSGADRYTGSAFPSLNGLLPISERFFAGGANTLRGFDFEEAGPRVAILPTGTFRDSKGNIINLPNFTIPFGGNALAIVNLEARIPLSKSLRGIAFYDGGNVFRRAGDIVKPPPSTPLNVELQNQRALWTNTVGIGLRLKTPVGGEFGVDYGYLLNPPEFLVPQSMGPPAVLRLRQGHFHFRFSQAF